MKGKLMKPNLHPHYITDETGKKMSVVLSVDEYETLLEDIEDLAIVAERRDEPTISHEDLEAKLRADGLL
jgi:PHD/YefM family antitoxin component YafN of YafNO toxin-antitoxin module